MGVRVPHGGLPEPSWEEGGLHDGPAMIFSFLGLGFRKCGFQSFFEQL